MTREGLSSLPARTAPMMTAEERAARKLTASRMRILWLRCSGVRALRRPRRRPRCEVSGSHSPQRLQYESALWSAAPHFEQNMVTAFHPGFGGAAGEAAPALYILPAFRSAM